MERVETGSARCKKVKTCCEYILQIRVKRTHPALYRYTSRAAFDTFFDSLYHAITDTMNQQEFLCLVTLLNPKIGDGHTMFLPGGQRTEYNNTAGKFFPLSVTYTGKKLYVLENCSCDSSIEKGEELISINGNATAKGTCISAPV